MASLITAKAIMSHHHVLSSTRITTLCSDKAIDNQQRKTKLQISHRFFSRRTISAAVINSASPVPKKETVEDERRCHVAWTSVQQEKWEGELTVQGKIPTWLVCLLSSYYILQIYFSYIRWISYKYVSCTQYTLTLAHEYVYITRQNYFFFYIIACKFIYILYNLIVHDFITKKSKGLD